MSSHFVTFIVPLYQSAATVVQTLASIRTDLDQSGVEGEILVVNDGSRDEGPAIAARAAADDPRIRIIHQPNKGLAAARNTGLDHARSLSAPAQHWVRFLDADDLTVPGSTGKLISLATRLGTGAACGAHELVDEAGESLGWTAPAAPGPSGAITLDDLLGGNRMGVGTVLIRRDLLGPMRFDERLRVCEDWDLWLRLAQGGVRFAAAPPWCGPMKHYRVRRGSLSKDFSTMRSVGADVLRAAFARLGRSNDSRLTAALRGQALTFACMQAVSGSSDAADRAARMLPSLQGFSAAEVAQSLVWATLLGRGESPDRLDLHPRGKHAALASWLRTATASMGAEALEQIRDSFGRLAVNPATVAATCIRAAADGGADEVVILGLGLNGMRLVEACRRAGVAFSVRDDRLSAPLPAELAPDVAACVAPSDAPYGPDQFVIVSPELDAPLVRRLANAIPPGRLIRWSEARDSLVKTESIRPSAAARLPVTV